MASMASQLMESNTGKYPIILSDALLGRASKEVYTGVRYNHNPEAPPALAKIKPNRTGGTFDMTFNQDGPGSLYKYQGTRSSPDGKYVLIFDPSREAFVIHRVDSIFNLNLVRTPTNKDAGSLREQYPHFSDSTVPPSANKATDDNAKRLKKAREEETTGTSLALPDSSQIVPTIKKNDPPTEAEEEDEESDGDPDGLVIEHPGAQHRDFSPAFPVLARQHQHWTDAIEGEADDEDDDGDTINDEDMEELTLGFADRTVPEHDTPLPPHSDVESEADEEEGDDEEELEEEHAQEPEQFQRPQVADVEEDFDDLEKQLELELRAADESDVSEED